MRESCCGPPAIELSAGSLLSKILPNVDNLNQLYEQADVNLPFDKFMWIVAALTVVGGAVTAVFGPSPLLAPVGAAVMGVVPFMWLLRRKKKRIRLFLDAMPEAVELDQPRPAAPVTAWRPACGSSPRK